MNTTTSLFSQPHNQFRHLVMGDGDSQEIRLQKKNPFLKEYQPLISQKMMVTLFLSGPIN